MSVCEGGKVLMAQGGVIETQGMATFEGKAFVTTFVDEEPFGQMFLASMNMDAEAINAFIIGMRDHRDHAGPSEGLGN